MAKIKVFVISCSSDAELKANSLFVHIGPKGEEFAPESQKEARKRIHKCRKQYKCEICDAQIHNLPLDRTEKTRSQILSGK